MWTVKKKAGFTIVELLIVIVIIAILATITIVAYNGIQQQARDAQRTRDIGEIVKAIQRWSIETGQDFSSMPAGHLSVPAQGWYDVVYTGSSVKSYLVNSGYLPNALNDPINNKTGSVKYAYMIVECTSSDNKTRILLANMETTQTQTVAQQLGSPACTSTTYTSYLGATYGMDFARRVTVD